MRSTQLDLSRYDSDKVTNRYLQTYDPILQPWVEKKIVLLELGVYRGGSLLLWHDYFPLGTVVGIDIAPPQQFHGDERIHVYQGSQADPQFLTRIANQVAPDGFDIIIDDASHLGELTKTAFHHLFDKHLKPGGLYVIEDWGTGYWDDWPDGKSLDLKSYSRPQLRVNSLLSKVARRLKLKRPMRCHSYGMVGFLKQLVDEQAAQDVTRRQLRGRSERQSKFENMLITPSIVFVRKAADEIESA